MKREGFWRYATPPVNIQGVPLPFTMIYLFICPFPSKTTFWICTGIILFFVILDRSGWTVRTICTRIFSILRGAIASGRPWWDRHQTESPQYCTGRQSEITHLCQVKKLSLLCSGYRYWHARYCSRHHRLQ